MKKLTSHPSMVMINHYKNVLEAEGIKAELRNQHLGSIVGETPFVEVWIELWVLNDLDFDRAQQLIDGSAFDESPREPWRCRKCNEVNEGQFAVCWNCGAAAEPVP